MGAGASPSQDLGAGLGSDVARTFSSLVLCVEDTGYIYGRVHTTLGEIVCTHTF